jgi:hypothetical protein
MLRIDAGYSWTIDPALFREKCAKICQESDFIFARTIFLVVHSPFFNLKLLNMSATFVHGGEVPHKEGIKNKRPLCAPRYFSTE